MPNRNQTEYLDQRGDLTGPSEKRDYPERPQHVPIEQKHSHETRGRGH